MEEESVFVRYHKKFGERIGIPMGLPDWDKYQEELERCIVEGVPYDITALYSTREEGAVI